MVTEENLETISEYVGDDGRTLVIAVDDKNRLHVNGNLVVTENRVRLTWWVQFSAVLAGVSTLALALIEVGRVLKIWT